MARGPSSSFSPGVWAALTPLLAAGTPPAMASMDASQGVEFVDRGEMASLDDFIRRDKYDLTDYIPVSLEQYRWKRSSTPWCATSPTAACGSTWRRSPVQ